MLGFSVFGVRFRQEVCVRWISEQRTIDYVLHHLHEANFDPEFSRRFERDVRHMYSGERNSVTERGQGEERSIISRLLAPFQVR